MQNITVTTARAAKIFQRLVNVQGNKVAAQIIRSGKALGSAAAMREHASSIVVKCADGFVTFRADRCEPIAIRLN